MKGLLMTGTGMIQGAFGQGSLELAITLALSSICFSRSVLRSAFFTFSMSPFIFTVFSKTKGVFFGYFFTMVQELITIKHTPNAKMIESFRCLIWIGGIKKITNAE
jgi:hypothetical protein